MTAEEAYTWGIVNRVVAKEDLLSAVAEMAGAMAAMAPQSLAVIKRVVHEGLDSPLSVGLTLEQDATARLVVTEDAREGIAAFIEKRDAQFPGRRKRGRLTGT